MQRTTSRTATVLLTAAFLITALGADIGGATTPSTFDALRADYSAMAAALQKDDASSVPALAARFVEHAASVPAPRQGTEALRNAAELARSMTTSDLVSLRSAFAAVSKQLATVVDDSGKPLGSLYHCPMADAYWLQPENERGIANPYLGPAMAGCGTRVTKVEN